MLQIKGETRRHIFVYTIISGLPCSAKESGVRTLKMGTFTSTSLPMEKAVGTPASGTKFALRGRRRLGMWNLSLEK